MKIVAVSDLHGHLPDIPECDLLLIAGDIIGYNNIIHQFQYLNGPFREWLERIPATKVVGIAGNHDWIFQKSPELVPRNLRWTYLQDEYVEIEGLIIYGSPWQLWFHNWAFNLHEHELDRKWKLIHDDTDILITHSPPHGFGDRVVSSENVGSPGLTNRIKEIQPKLHVFGHIHRGYGSYWIDGTLAVNAALVDDGHRLINKPVELELR